MSPRSARLADHRADLLDHRRLDAFGRFVEDQQLRLAGQRAADRQLLLLAAGEIAAAPLLHLAQHREQLVDLLRYPAGLGAGEARQPHQQVLFHRQARENLPPLRHVGDAGLHPLVRLARVNQLVSPARRRTSPVLAGTSPIRHFSSVVLPTPLRPSRQVTSPVRASNDRPRRIWLPP